MDELLCQRLRKYISSFVSPKRIDDGLQLMIHAADAVVEPAYTLESITTTSADFKVADDMPLDVAVNKIGRPCEVLINRLLRVPFERIKEIIIYRGTH
jgi:hypothetical protein